MNCSPLSSLQGRVIIGVLTLTPTGDIVSTDYLNVIGAQDLKLETATNGFTVNSDENITFTTTSTEYVLH